MKLGKREKKVFDYLIEAMKVGTGRFGTIDLQKNADYGIDPPDRMSFIMYNDCLYKLETKGLVELIKENNFSITDEGLEFAGLEPEEYPEYDGSEDKDENNENDNHPDLDNDDESTGQNVAETKKLISRQKEKGEVSHDKDNQTNFEFIKNIKPKSIKEIFIEFVSSFAGEADINTVQDPKLLKLFADYLNEDNKYLPFGEITEITWKFGTKTLKHPFDLRVPIFLNINKSRLEIPIKLNERGIIF